MNEKFCGYNFFPVDDFEHDGLCKKRDGHIYVMKRQELGKAKVIEVNAEYSICKVVEGVGIRKGDVLKRG